jgi:hypothetical protein
VLVGFCPEYTEKQNFECLHYKFLFEQLKFMPKLILHAGIHKTGTTAIQAFAHKNRSAFAESGILYPQGRTNKRWEQPAEAHHEFAHAIADKDKYLKWNQVEILTRSWAKEASDKGLGIFISSEAIYRHVLSSVQGPWAEKRKGYLDRLSTALSGFDVSVVLVLRRQDDYIKSLFQEAVMKNTPAGRKPFVDFRKQYLTDHKKRSFYENLRLFEAFFPKVNVLIYEDLVHNPGLCANFFTHIGLDTKKMAEVGIVRRSLRPGETLLKLFLNQAITSPKQNKKILDWIHCQPVQKLLEKYYGNTEYDLWENVESRKKFLERFQEENKQICVRYFPGKKHLFPEIEEHESSNIGSLPDKCKADMVMLALNQPWNTSFKQDSYTKRMLQWLRNLA